MHADGLDAVRFAAARATSGTKLGAGGDLWPNRTSSTLVAEAPRTCLPCGARTGWTSPFAMPGRSGSVLSGVSAGMLCWFSGGLTDSYGGLERLNDGLALIEATACPHYGEDEERRRAFHRTIAQGLGAGYAADDGAALHFAGSALAEAVSSRPEAGAYRVELVEGTVVETRLPVRFLGHTESGASLSITSGSGGCVRSRGLRNVPRVRLCDTFPGWPSR